TTDDEIAKAANLTVGTVRHGARKLFGSTNLPKIDRTGVFVQKLADKLKPSPTIISRIQELASFSSKKDELYTLSDASLVLGTAYIAYLEIGNKMSQKALCQALDMDRSVARISAKRIKAALNLKVEFIGGGRAPVDTRDPKLHLADIVEKIKPSQQLINRAAEILGEAEQKVTAKFYNKTLAGGVLYAAALETHDAITAKAISQAAGVSSAPLGHATKQIIKDLGLTITKAQTKDEIRAEKTKQFFQKLTSSLGMPKKTIETASEIFERAIDSKYQLGRQTNEIICTVVYAACRLDGLFNRLEDIISKGEELQKKAMSIKEVSGYYRELIFTFDLKMPVPDMEAGLSQMAQKVGVSDQTKTAALKMLRRVKNNVSGVNPYVLSAALLYKAARATGEKKVATDIADAIGITPVSIRNVLKKNLSGAN
ncbi:MAG: hypothetical protein KGH49_02875, partial [Candidatus Micrarchaeota archaeon]|nr:hypothetical protein [Candidatus Micrarchaeota archaeon]